MRHLGNISVTHETYPSFPPGEEIFGHVTIESPPKDAFLHNKSYKVDTGRLTLIRGWLTLMPGTQMIAPRLGTVDGWLELKGSNAFISSALTKITQDFIIGGSDGDVLLDNLKTVGMSIALWHGVLLTLPELLSAGNIALRPGAKLIVPKLARVDGSITLQQDSVLDAPELAHIGRYVDAHPASRLHAPLMGGRG